MTDLLLQRLARFFDENDTAASFLSEDGDGGYVAAVTRMTQEIEQRREAVAVVTAQMSGFYAHPGAGALTIDFNGPEAAVRARDALKQLLGVAERPA